MNQLRFYAMAVSVLGVVALSGFFALNTEPQLNAEPKLKLRSEPTLTFHIMARNDEQAVLGGSLEGPEDSAADHAELIVQFYRAGQLLETRTLFLKALVWPKSHFKQAIPGNVDCYEVVALRTFDKSHQPLPSIDATTALLQPGRCQTPAIEAPT
jgi:hypothetical protein